MSELRGEYGGDDVETTARVAEATTIESLAAIAAESFETARRATGDTATGPREDGEPYVRIKDDAPQWVTDMTYAAHGDMLPDDTRYAMVREAVDAIVEATERGDDLDETADEFADDVPTYNGERIAWLGSHGLRPGYVDQAVEDSSAPNDRSIMETIALGIYAERREVFEAVRDFLATKADL